MEETMHALSFCSHKWQTFDITKWETINKMKTISQNTLLISHFKTHFRELHK